MSDFTDYVRSLPKAELHLHIEGTLEPELLMRLVQKHRVEIPYQSIADIKRAYQFDDLQSFLDLYYLGASVLIEEEDFYILMFAYLQRCLLEGIVHTEMMFDPQTHTDRGIDFSVFMSGFKRAIDQAQREWGMSCFLIMCFLRHLTQESAFDTLDAAMAYKDQIIAVGLDSAESGNPPEKFAAVFQTAMKQGYRLVAHAGEEGPPAYIWSALDSLGVARIDHGVRCLDDAVLVQRLVDQRTPLTVCPLSNVRLCVFTNMSEHPILAMLDRGLNVSVNSDDPSYFGGYLLDNLTALHEALGLTEAQADQLAVNSFEGSFLDASIKASWIAQISSP